MHQQLMVVNDYAGVGKVAANVNVPILSAAQFEVAVLPTLLLSNHVGTGSFYTHELEKDYEVFLNHWNELGMTFTACLTGFFANKQQLDSVIKFACNDHRQLMLIVDPIMGEDGELYPGFTEEFVDHMRSLIVNAEIVMPNITEACRLAQVDYSEEFTQAELHQLASTLAQMGAKNVIITGVRLNTPKYRDQIGFYLLTDDGQSTLVMHKYYKTPYTGTGDLALSIISSFFLRGLSLEESIQRCAEYMVKTFEATAKKERSELGIYFESLIPEFAIEVNELIQNN